MTAFAIATRARTGSSGALLIIGIVLAALTEAIASTAFALGRSDVIGDTHATPDEFAWLDITYIAAKLIGFLTAPWLMTKFPPSRLLLTSILVLGVASALASITAWLDLLILLRMAQGFAGGVLLVVGQAIIFLTCPRAHQPILQAVFAVGAVVAPATIAPTLQGWLIDTHSWSWIFFATLPAALASAGVLLIADDASLGAAASRPFDWLGFVLISTAFVCFSFVFSQGSRWRWLEDPQIITFSILGIVSLITFAIQQALSKGKGLVALGAFQSENFTFAFVVSFVAGAVLFGSAFMIPSFAVSVLAFTPTAAGLLLLPSGFVFVAALLLAAFLVQKRGVPAIAGAPLGILALMAAMWMLSGSTLESGAADMGPALLLRGLGLGFLFLAITLIAFTDLKPRDLAAAIGLFNAGRQLGGLMGVAGLQTLIDHNIAANVTVLGASIASGTAAANERIAAMTALLQMRGLDPSASHQVAIGLLAQMVTRQATVIAFETAFVALVLLFVVAAPIVIIVRTALRRHTQRRVATHQRRSPSSSATP